MGTDTALQEPMDVLRAAHQRLLNDAVLRYRAEVTAQVLRRLRTEDQKTLRIGLEDDRVIAACALVVATMDLPGGASSLDLLASLLAHHAFSHVNSDGWTVCLCGHVATGDDDDGSHARHQADVITKGT